MTRACLDAGAHVSAERFTIPQWVGSQEHLHAERKFDRAYYETVKRFSQRLVQHLARVIPDRFVAKSGSANRVGKIFVDYLRNSHGQTTGAAYSARSWPGLGVSMPVAWEQLNELKSGAQWSIAMVRDYLSLKQLDPWQAYWKKRQTIAAALQLLE